MKQAFAKYFWDLNRHALKETAGILKNMRHPKFPSRMVTLLSRCDQPKELFLILPKHQFLKGWPLIRAYWIKRTRTSQHRDWWQTLYEQMVSPSPTQAKKPGGSPAAFFRRMGHFLKEARIEKGLSQKQLALQTGLKQPTVSQIEEGKKNITLLTLLRLCRALDIKKMDLNL